MEQEGQVTTREKLARELCRWHDSWLDPNHKSTDRDWEITVDKDFLFREADRIIKLLKGGKK